MTQSVQASVSYGRPLAKPALSILDGFRLTLAGRQHTAAVDALRQQAYSNASYFSLPDPTAVMRQTDPVESMCLIVVRQGEIAATVRVTFASDRAAAQSILEGTAEVPDNFFPTVAVCRGATDPRYRGLGLMAFLVSMAVRIAWTAKLGSALAVQSDDIPHYPAMNRAGWQKKPIGSDYMATVGDHSALRLVYLGHDLFERSVAHSARVHFQLCQRFEVDRLINSSVWLIHKQRNRLHANQLRPHDLHYPSAHS
jgi:GNAT superfamily N-acetyltransferase